MVEWFFSRIATPLNFAIRAGIPIPCISCSQNLRRLIVYSISPGFNNRCLNRGLYLYSIAQARRQVRRELWRLPIAVLGEAPSRMGFAAANVFFETDQAAYAIQNATKLRAFLTL